MSADNPTPGPAVTSADPLVSFIYELGRDHLPLGTIERVANNSPAGIETRYRIGHLANYAQDVAARLRPPQPQTTPAAAAKSADPHPDLTDEELGRRWAAENGYHPVAPDGKQQPVARWWRSTAGRRHGVREEVIKPSRLPAAFFAATLMSGDGNNRDYARFASEAEAYAALGRALRLAWASGEEYAGVPRLVSPPTPTLPPTTVPAGYFASDDASEATAARHKEEAPAQAQAQDDPAWTPFERIGRLWARQNGNLRPNQEGSTLSAGGPLVRVWYAKGACYGRDAASPHAALDVAVWDRLQPRLTRVDPEGRGRWVSTAPTDQEAFHALGEALTRAWDAACTWIPRLAPAPPPAAPAPADWTALCPEQIGRLWAGQHGKSPVTHVVGSATWYAEGYSGSDVAPGRATLPLAVYVGLRCGTPVGSSWLSMYHTSEDETEAYSRLGWALKAWAEVKPPTVE